MFHRIIKSMHSSANTVYKVKNQCYHFLRQVHGFLTSVRNASLLYPVSLWRSLELQALSHLRENENNTAEKTARSARSFG